MFHKLLFAVFYVARVSAFTPSLMRAQASVTSAGDTEISNKHSIMSHGKKQQHRAVSVTSAGDTERSMGQKNKVSNPAGCLQPKGHHAMENFDGVFPLEEFSDMLATRKGTLWYNEAKNDTLSKKYAVPFCPVPLGQNSFSELQDGTDVLYIEEALKGTDSNKPIILAFAEINIKHDYRLLQIMNLICGFQRLGLDRQVVFFTMDNKSAQFLRRFHPWLRVLHHDSLKRMIERAGKRTNVPGNRIAKLVITEMLVKMQKEVLLTDLDVHWIQDPIPYLQSLKTPSNALVDMAAMKDNCWLELNSGFVYYRPTDRTKNLLRMALNTEKFEMEHPDVPGKLVTLLADNDQYLLNCALARSALAGLNYVILARELFTFGDVTGTNRQCHDQTAQTAVLTAPLIWHTAGFSTAYEMELDRFAALGFIDVHASSGQCVAGRRGSPENVQNASSALIRLCSKKPDGILTASCLGECANGAEPTLARELLSNFGQVALE